MKLTNYNRMQKRRVDLIDSDDEALLASDPPDPQANTIGNGKWRKQDSGERRSRRHQNNEENRFLNGICSVRQMTNDQ